MSIPSNVLATVIQSHSNTNFQMALDLQDIIFEEKRNVLNMEFKLEKRMRDIEDRLYALETLLQQNNKNAYAEKE